MKYNEIIKEIWSTKKFIPLAFLISGIAFFVGAADFSSEARMFPRLSSAAVIIGSFLILFSGVLPQSLRLFIESGQGLADVLEDEETASAAESEEQSPEEAPGHEDTTVDRPLDPYKFTILLVLMYMILGYLISIAITTPLFVAAYLMWFDQSRVETVGLITASAVIVYLFMTVFNIPLTDALLVDFFLFSTEMIIDG